MKKLFILLIVSALFITVGCDSLLDIDQPDIVEDENAYKTYNEGLVSVIGSYQGLQEMVEQIFLLENVRTDLILVNDNAPLYLKELSNGVYSKDNPYLDSSPFYKVVNQTNSVLDNLDELQKGGEVFLSNAIVKEKYCLRGCIVNFRTSRKDIEEIIEIVVREGKKMHQKLQSK